VEDAVAIRTEGLTKSYRSGDEILTVFHDLQLTVKTGERVALIGESGTGKSSLLHCLGGLDRPSEGKIYFGQNDLQALTESQLADFRNREIGFVWQTHYLLPEFTAQENVMMPLLIRGESQEKAAPLALARLDEVGLRARAHHRSGELSGGEQQRVVLARALVGNPRYLFADEPTGNLDERTGEMISRLLKELHKMHQLTSIYVTHSRDFARSCDRVLRLQHGGLADVTAGM
jgi:lipoprotein-releasing system ATP-binding protein